MIIKNAQVFVADGSFEKKDLYTDGDKISSDSTKDQTVIDGTGCIAIPGLTDIHFHGCVGYDFCDGTREAITAMAGYELQNGVMAICPATMTLSEDVLSSICETASGYQNEEGSDLVGINMEGPFISLEKKGAQNPKYIRVPDVEMFRKLLKTANGLVKLVDIAPEAEGADRFIQELKDEVVISLAHTMADYDTSAKAFSLGASHVTHLYNAMQPFTHRAPGLIGAACENPNVNVELICDGVHIHPAAVRTTFQMFGDDRICLISDSMMATGLEDGDYALGGQPVKVVGNLATLSDGTIAGSATNLMDCMRTAVKDMKIPLGSAVKCASVNPSKAIGVYDCYGSLDTGKYANIVLLDEKTLEIKTLIFKGKIMNS